MAVIAKQKYKLDIAPSGGWVIVYASQHDNGAREVEFEITNQGNAYSIPASINISVQGVKSNKGYFSHSCSYSGNVVTMALADDMTDVIGKAICVLKFTNSSQQKLATAKFILNVDSDSSSEGIIIDTEAEEIFNQMLDEIRAQAASVSADIAELQSMVGSPLVASTASAMTDHNKIYVYTGSESGYTNGNWYYWNGSAWTSGGVYNAVAINIDSTPTQGSNNTVSSGGVWSAITNAIDTLENEISGIVPGLSSEAKEALLACFRGVLWASKDGQSYYDALQAALYGQEPVPVPVPVPTIEPTYDLRKMEYSIGSGGPNAIYTWSGNTRTNTGKNLFFPNSLTNRARFKSLMPAVSGTITAMTGYEVCVYTFDSIQFESSYYYTPKTDVRNQFGSGGAVNFNTSAPAWVQSYTIEDSNCKFILVAFRKTNNADWTQSELQNMYGTVYTAHLSPSYRLFDIAEYTGGYTYGEGDTVKDEDVIDGGLTHRRHYVKKTALSARAIVDYLPITNGVFRSADSSKYQITVYQIDSTGGFIWDTENPNSGGTYATPAWADEYDLSLNPKQNEVFCVCISFKKLDGTDFTQEELSNMYGTVFTYSEGV